MVIPLNECCCLPIRPGCVLIGIIFGVENFGAFVTITLMIRGESEHLKNVESKALNVCLVFLSVMSLTMFFTDIYLIVGTLMKWKSLLYSWVIVYTALICTKTLSFIITAIICIVVTNCRIDLAILMLAVAYIPMAIYCYSVIVVYSYYIIVSQQYVFRPIMHVRGSGNTISTRA